MQASFRAVLSILVLAFVLVPLLAVANKGGPTSGNSGDPVFNRTCRNCHGGFPLNQPPVTLTIETPTGKSGAPGTYSPGSILPVRVTLEGPVQSPRNGFEISAWKRPTRSFTDLLSGWSLAQPRVTRLISQHVTHNLNGNLRTSWDAYFMTPPTPTAMTMYCAGNDANNNCLSTGDRIYTTKLDLDPGTVPLTLRALPRIGQSATLLLDSPADAGRPFVLGASLGNTGIPIGSRVIPLSADPLLVAVLAGLLPGVTRGYVGLLDGQGRATATLAVPSIAALEGLILHHAFVVIDSRQPGGIGTISNPLPLTLVP